MPKSHLFLDYGADDNQAYGFGFAGAIVENRGTGNIIQ